MHGLQDPVDEEPDSHQPASGTGTDICFSDLAISSDTPWPLITLQIGQGMAALSGSRRGSCVRAQEGPKHHLAALQELESIDAIAPEYRS